MISKLLFKMGPYRNWIQKKENKLFQKLPVNNIKFYKKDIKLRKEKILMKLFNKQQN